MLHRDYKLDGPVQVVHSPEAFKVTSPGPLVAGVTDSNRQLLADLVRREVLVKTSEAERGPSVDYGPGPSFPRKTGGAKQAEAK